MAGSAPKRRRQSGSLSNDLHAVGTCLASVVFESISAYDDAVNDYLTRAWGELRDDAHTASGAPSSRS